MTSETRIRYGSRVVRHGYARRRGAYQRSRAFRPNRRGLGLDGAMTTVRDVMSKEVVTVEPTATVAEAATMMGAHHVGSALVLEEGRPAGIFTERDILRALAADFDAAQHHISQWMTPDPVTVEAGTDVREARDIMLDRGFRHLPVMDGAALVGVSPSATFHDRSSLRTPAFPAPRDPPPHPSGPPTPPGTR